MTRSPFALVRARPEPLFEITVDGVPTPALPGQTLAAAMWSAGLVSWRRTRGRGQPRGVFCGMGVCYDCLVVLDGQPNVRACQAPANPNARVTTQEGDGHAALRP